MDNACDLFCILLLILYIRTTVCLFNWWDESGSKIWSWLYPRIIDNLLYYKWSIVGVMAVHILFICLMVYCWGEIQNLPRSPIGIKLPEGGYGFI